MCCVNPTTCSVCPKPRVFSCVPWVEMRMVVHFIDIGWIVDHHCSHFLFKSNTTCVTCGAGTAYIPIFGDVRVDRFIICNVLKVIVCPFALLQWYLYWISFSDLRLLQWYLYWISFSDLRLLITRLVYSNFSFIM